MKRDPPGETPGTPCPDLRRLKIELSPDLDWTLQNWRIEKAPGQDGPGQTGGTAIKIVGEVTKQVEQLLGITVPDDRTIYLGQTNLNHMRTAHPADFAKYGADLITILAYPDYVGQNPADGSIEYVKEFLAGGEYVKVAVRLAKTDRFYARSLYILNNKRVQNYINKGTLKKT